MPYENLGAHLLQPVNQARRLLKERHDMKVALTETERPLFHAALALAEANARLIDRLLVVYEAFEGIADEDLLPFRRDSLTWQVRELEVRLERLERALPRRR